MRKKKRPDAETICLPATLTASVSENDLRSFFKRIIASDRSKVEKKRMCYILRALPEGHESPVLTPDLMERTGYSLGIIKTTVRHMRVLGIPVASSAKGYYLCANDYERQMFYETLMKRIRTAVEESKCFYVRRARVK